MGSSTAAGNPTRSRAWPYVSFRVLGPVAVLDDQDAVIPLGPPRYRTLLAALLVHAGATLSVDRLTDLLWDGSPPPTARTMVHGAVAGLRKALGPCRAEAASGCVQSRDGGYGMDVRPEQLDVGIFEGLLEEGRRLVDVAPARASQLLAEALALWRGPALAGIENAFAREAAARWDELHLECREERMQAELAVGHHSDVVAELQLLVARHPLRERLCAQLVVALYRCGRQADALSALRTTRRKLVDELGLEPGLELQRLERAVLQHSHELDVVRARPSSAHLGRPLPAPLSTFVGRVRERDEIAALLTTHRLVTLTGTGGSGKTRLAQEVGRQLVDHRTAEVWFVDLTPLRTPELVGETVAEALGVRSAPSQGLVETVAAALAGHAGHAAVLLLDNCEHLVEACAAFAQSLLAAAPEVRLLTTSREALQVPGERVWVVRPLVTAELDVSWEDMAACEAAQLFAQRAAAGRPRFAVSRTNARLVLEICRRLDGLPLALELAAARAASMALPDLAERLDDCFRLLDSSVRCAGLRHRSLAATLAWSVDLLDEPARLLFARVSVFPAAFTLAAAEDVVSDDDLPAQDVVLVLARLVSSSTVQLEEGSDGATRYRLLETTRQYARERLDPAAAADLRARHAGHFLALAQQAEPRLLGPASSSWLTRLQVEHDNFRAALEWAFGPDGDPQLGAGLVTCLWHPWDVRGLRGEGLHWVHAALQALGPHSAEQRLPLLAAGALFHLGRAEFPEVASMAHEQLVLARSCGAQAWEGDALAMQATVAWARGEFDRAQHLYEDAVTASLDGDDLWRATLAEAQLARLHRDRDEPDAARSVVLHALRHAQEVGEELALGLALDVLASLEQRWGEPSTAGRLADEALDHYRAVGYLEGEASALHLAGRIALSSGQPQRAREAFEQSLRLCQRIGHRGGSATALEALAAVAAAADHHDRALMLLGAATALRNEIGSPLTGTARADDLRQRERVAERLGPQEAAQALRRGASLPPHALLEP